MNVPTADAPSAKNGARHAQMCSVTDLVAAEGPSRDALAHGLRAFIG
ncbi:MAG: hypothetical protein ABJP66_06790 [Hyphomicrobiales bacterium]